jgi:hypothetical protein
MMWWLTLGVRQFSSLAVIDAAFIERALATHNPERLLELVQALRQARKARQ